MELQGNLWTAVGSTDDLSHVALRDFHPLIQTWFRQTLGEPTEPQIRGWPLIRQGKDVLIAAPTGSGKTLSAFLACLDDLVKLALAGQLTDETRMVYISPLKALGNDIQKNVLRPLEELKQLAAQWGLELPEIRVKVRTGDTDASERAAMVKKPPHILITTPESLYLCLTAGKSRETLRSVRTVVVDEIHALARDKRGAHCALSLERLKHISRYPVQCVGLSATQKPIDKIARFLVGAPRPDHEACHIVQVGHLRPWQLWVEVPEDELSAVATHEMWGQIYARIQTLSSEYRTLLVFVNTRKLAERVAHDLKERFGKEVVAAHHGSMSKDLRLKAEERLKSGQLKIMVATASLELGLDIGSIDLVCQIGSPRSISVMLQRLGRAGHHKSAVSRAVMFAMTRDELVECVALKRCIEDKILDAVRMPVLPLDVLAQQMVAEVAAEEWDEDELFNLCRRAMHYEDLTREDFEKVLHMQSEGVATQRGRSRVHLHRDRVNGRLRPRKAARLMAVQNAGTIPDTFSYPVIAEPEEKQVGALDEDFAIESSAGDVFLLGTTSWRVRRIWNGQVRVEDAQGAPPSVPFWQGESPGRTSELSAEVARLRQEVLEKKDAQQWLENELQVQPYAAETLVKYVRAGAAALGGVVPTQTTLVAERFFDDAGGMQLIIHAPFGSRVNRAWGMALRKSFCRAFDFELQAAATDDGILLSLGEQHSFPLIDIFDFVSANTAEQVLTQAVLQAPLFATRFRWTANRALALTRSSMGQRVPPPIQRARAEDLIAAVFPAQVGCQDNHGGADIEPPDHPLVTESLKDCLRDNMDIDGLVLVLRALKDGSILKKAVDAPEPSVFAHQLLNSAPYTFLDEAPLEERRARSVTLRRTLPAEDAVKFGSLDQAAVDQVLEECMPEIRDADEWHDFLLQVGYWEAPIDPPEEQFQNDLEEQQRASQFVVLDQEKEPTSFAFPRERVSEVKLMHPVASISLEALPQLGIPTTEDAVKQTVRGWMEVVGPTRADVLAARMRLSTGDVEQALAQLEMVGQVVRGHFTSQSGETTEWCDRRLLQRMHRLTVNHLRREIEPLSAQDFMRFLFEWHGLNKQGPDSELHRVRALNKAVEMLQGCEAPAAAWEKEIFSARVRGYEPGLLDRACMGGQVAWGRLREKEKVGPNAVRRGLPVEPSAEVTKSRANATWASNTPMTFCQRVDLPWLLSAARPNVLRDDGLSPLPDSVSEFAREVYACLDRRGAMFFNELQAMLKAEPRNVEKALWELLSLGRITGDAVENLRVLLSPRTKRRHHADNPGGPGRWSILAPLEKLDEEAVLQKLGMVFLKRYGIVCRELVARENFDVPWRELVRVYRRMEARGEIRGGRFIGGTAGEQFATSEAVMVARDVRRKVPHKEEHVRISAVDPLNLTGILTPGPRVPAVMGNYVNYVNGVPQDNSWLSEAFDIIDQNPVRSDGKPWKRDELYNV